MQPLTQEKKKQVVTVTCRPLGDWCKQIAPAEITIRVIPPFVTHFQTVKTLQNAVLHICFGIHPLGYHEINLSRHKNNVAQQFICYKMEEFDRSYWAGVSNKNADKKLQASVSMPRQVSGNKAYKWLDPIWAQETIRRIAERFKELWPQHAERIEQKTQDYLYEIFQIHLKMAETIGRFPQKTYVDTHSRLPFLANRYGMEPIGDIKGDLHSISSLIKAVKPLRDLKRIVIFSGPLSQTPWEAVIGESTQYAVFPLDFFGHSHHPKRNTYLGMMQYNLSQIEKGLTFLSNPS